MALREYLVDCSDLVEGLIQHAAESRTTGSTGAFRTCRTCLPARPHRTSDAQHTIWNCHHWPSHQLVVGNQLSLGRVPPFVLIVIALSANAFHGPATELSSAQAALHFNAQILCHAFA